MKTPCALVTTVLALFAFGGAAAHANSNSVVGLLFSSSDGLELGRVEKMGATERVVPERANKVREGDIITASREVTFSLLTNTGEHKTETVGPDRPYVVRGIGKPSSTWGNVYNWLQQWLVPPHDHYDVDVAAVRGGPLKMPLASSPNNKIIAGGRGLAIAWTGGRRPVTATIYAGRSQRAKVTGLTGEKAIIAVSDGKLEANSYRLVLDDGYDTLEVRFDAYEPSRLPQPKLAASVADTGTAFGPLAKAVELATVEGGAWRLEAYRQLITHGSEAALVMAARLALGSFPSIP